MRICKENMVDAYLAKPLIFTTRYSLLIGIDNEVI